MNLDNYYMMAATSKRLLISESRDDLNRCTPYRGKPNQHDTHASHTSPYMPRVCFLRAVPVRGNLSRGPNRVRHIHCYQEKVLPTPLLRLAEWPAGLDSVSLPI
jgi:hypothetical protein